MADKPKKAPRPKAEVQKKVFAPKPAQARRRRPADGAAAGDGGAAADQGSKGRGRGRGRGGRGRGRGGRGRGRGTGDRRRRGGKGPAANVVQPVGIFSRGMGPRGGPRRGGAAGAASGRAPSVSITSSKATTSANGQRTSGAAAATASGSGPGPASATGRAVTKAKAEVVEEGGASSDEMDSEDESSWLKHFTSAPNTERVVALPLGDSVSMHAANTYQADDQSSQKPALGSEVLQRREDALLFVQIPDVLPLPAKATVSVPGGAAAADTKAPGQDKTKPPSAFANAPEGCLGKLRIRKSGRMELVMGDLSFVVEDTGRCSFLQHIMAAELGTKMGQPGVLTDLGHIAAKLLIRPDVEQLLDRTARR